jgi:hypothetical protein
MESTVFHCCNVFTEPLHSNGRGADTVENSLLLGLFTEPLLSNVMAIHVTLLLGAELGLGLIVLAVIISAASHVIRRISE